MFSSLAHCSILTAHRQNPPTPTALNTRRFTPMHEDHSQTQSYIRMALYVGVFAMLGAGVFARYVGMEAAKVQNWRLWYLLSLGFTVTLASTLYGVYHVTWMLGDTSLMWSYISETTQGTLLMARVVFLVALLGLSLGWAPLDKFLYPPLALGLLFTVALTSHSGAAGGAVLWVDLIHLGFGAIWAGSATALAITWPGTRFEAVKAALARLSGLGLPSVIILSLAGFYLGYNKLNGLANLTGSEYGRTLLIKLGLVLGIVALAALNRFWLMPRFHNKHIRGLNTVSLEALLIVGVLLSTGVLASTPLPPSQAKPADLNMVVNINETIAGNRYIGQVFSSSGLIHFYLDIRNPQGDLLSTAPAIPIRAQLGEKISQENTAPFNKSQYHSALIAEPSGRWKVTLELGEKTLEYELEVR